MKNMSLAMLARQIGVGVGKRCSSGRIRFSPASRAACSTLRVVCGDTPPRSVLMYFHH
jgi:hypothetical protein